ncbi:MAG TPA: class IV adenylate cyclase [Gammaproteobacteria bacterium]|nr:class IV adenylate cyclase [Gammaproteobacteria bacterium]
MARNVEIKARVDDLEALRRRLATLPIRGEEHLDQIDTFFRVAHGRLKLREFADGSAELIYYDRPDNRGVKLSQYERLPLPKPAALKRVLTTSLGVRGTVTKHRDVYLLGQTRIHLDTVERLGTFLELEVVLGESDTPESSEALATELLRALQIAPQSLLPGAYIDLLESNLDQSE